MSVKLDQAFASLSELKMWFKNKAGQTLTLADVNELISLRWNYFKENWEFIKVELTKKIDLYEFPDLLSEQIDKLSTYIERQRNNTNTTINPFLTNSILTDYYAVWENLSITSIPTTRQEQKLIKNKISSISRFVKTDFIGIRNNLIVARDEIADTIGLSDGDYNLAQDRSSITQLRDPRISDITNMQTLHTGIIAIDYILANISSLDTVNIDPFTLARTNADNSDIDISNAKSGRLVKMNFGDSLQSLSTKYYGNPDKWLDIAIANGLKAPYIDEVGTVIPIISNGNGNQLNISAEDIDGNKNVDKLYINQAIFLKSDATTSPEQRTITNIKVVPISGEIVLELAGDTDLDKYKIIDNAVIRVYKQNTINSQFLILIPSDQPLPQQKVGVDPFFLKSLTEDEKNSGIDLAVNGDMDIVFTSTNDLQLSFGLSNAVQAIQYKMMTEKGQLPRHPDYGLPQVAGQKANDPDAIKQVLINGINDMINADSRFSRIERLDVIRPVGNEFRIKLNVRMAGTGTVVPISFSVNTG